MKNLFLLITLLGSLVAMTICNNCSRQEISRLESNQEALMSEANDYRTLSELQAQTINRLALTANELKQYNYEATETIKDLKIKLRDVQAVADIADNGLYYFAPDTVRDTTVVVDTIKISPTLYYSDQWITLAVDTSGMVAISTRDTINVVLHQRQRRFLWWRWRTGVPQASVVSRNPHHKIEAIQVIDIIDK